MKTTTSTTTAVAAVTIPAPARKLLFGADFGALVARCVIGEDEALFRPSDITMSDSVANAAMGAKLTLDGFVRALAYKTVRLAWGACRIDATIKDLPPFAQEAVRFAHSRLVGTRGISAGLLRIVVADAAAHAANLPLRSKVKVTDKTPGKVENKAPALDMDRVADHARLQALGMLERKEADHEKMWAEYGDTLLRGMRAALATVRSAMAPSPHVTLKAEFAAMPEDARESLLRELAESIGMRVTRLSRPAKAPKPTKVAEPVAA